MARRPKWTDAEIKQFLSLVETTLYAHEIAEKLGKTEHAVRGQFKRMGIKRRHSGVCARAAKERSAGNERLRQIGRNLAARTNANRSGFEDRRRASISRARMAEVGMADMPAHVVESYHAMRQKRFSAQEAAAIAIDEWRAQFSRAMRQISAVAPMAAAEAKRQADKERERRRSFAGQMERVQAGAAVVPAIRLSRPVGTPRSLIGGGDW